jgi:hypothetical protein
MPVDRTPAGRRRVAITLTRPGAGVPNSDGGYDATVEALDPSPVMGSVEQATPRDLERLVAGTVLSVDSYVVVIPYHEQVTTETTIGWRDRLGRDHTANVTGYSNPDQKCIETVMIAAEITT